MMIRLIIFGCNRCLATTLDLHVPCNKHYYFIVWTVEAKGARVVARLCIGGDLVPSLGGRKNFCKRRFLNDVFLLIDHVFQIFPISFHIFNIFTVENVVYDPFFTTKHTIS